MSAAGILLPPSVSVNDLGRHGDKWVDELCWRSVD